MSAPQKSLLIQLDSQRPMTIANSLSRREALRVGLAVTVSGILIPTLPPFSSDAQAHPLGWLAWTGRTAFAAGIAWLVNRVLDKRYPSHPDTLGVKSIAPTPTADHFHNSQAEPYVVTNARYNFRDEYSPGFGYYMGVNGYLRSNKTDPIPEIKDLATHEVKRIAKEESNYDTLLFPCGKRERPTQLDLVGYQDTCDEYRVDPDRLKLDYVRPFNDGQQQYLAYGVTSRRTGEKDLLVSV